MEIKISKIFIDSDGSFNFSAGRLASMEEAKELPNDENSIWGALSKDEWLECADGFLCAADYLPDDSPHPLRRVARVIVRCGAKQLIQIGLEQEGNFLERNFFGISETFELGEMPLDCAKRGIKEELNISGVLPEFIGVTYESKISPSAKLVTDYEFWDFEIQISKSQKNMIPLKRKESKGILILDWK